MSRLVIATTALVLSSVAAHAEITLSGDARMGVIKFFPDFGAVDNEKLRFTSRARVKVDMTGTTDGGLSFGASFRISDAEDASAGQAGEVSMAGDWGSITMGDVDSAALSAVDHVSAVGLTDLGNLNEIRYIANGFDGTDPSVLYRYASGDWAFYASVVNPGTVTETFDNTFTINDPDDFASITSEPGVLAYSVAARYQRDTYAVALGYETLSVDYPGGLTVDQQNVMLGVEATFDQLRLQAIVGHFQGSDVDFQLINANTLVGTQLNDLSGTQYAVSADYTIDDLTLTAFYTDDSEYDGSRAYGIGATYDLGGGASVKGGYVKDEGDGAVSYDIGVTMTF